MDYLKKLYKAHNNMKLVIQEVQSDLKGKIEFEEYHIFYQPSDGFVLSEEMNNAPLFKCLSIIEEKGTLSYEDYLKETI